MEETIKCMIDDIAKYYDLNETVKVPLPVWIKDNVTIEESNLEPMNIMHAFVALCEDIEERKTNDRRKNS